MKYRTIHNWTGLPRSGGSLRRPRAAMPAAAAKARRALRAVATLACLSALSSSSGAQWAAAEAGSDAGRDAGPPLPSMAPESAVADLTNWPAFERWQREMGVALLASTEPPLPPLVSAEDPDSWQAFLDYQHASLLLQAPVAGLPFELRDEASRLDGTWRSPLTQAVSLVLGKGDPHSLLQLSDFPRPGNGPRFTVACERHLAQLPGELGPLYEPLCGALGEVVPWSEVESLSVDGVKLARLEDCTLPSAVYGAYQAGNLPGAPGRYTWPDWRAGGSAPTQPCLSAFLHAQALTASGVPASGWLPVKSIPDLLRIDFPYSERDPDNGALDGVDGMPRGEFVSTRWLFEGGVGVYLGQSPIWKLPIEALYPGQERALIEVLSGGMGSACKPEAWEEAAPCVLSPQEPFLFPNYPVALWVRQVIDPTDRRWPAHNRSPLRFRNDYELLHGQGRDTLRSTMRDTLLTLNQAAQPGHTPASLLGFAEQLAAPWHSLLTQRGAISGYQLTARRRVALLFVDESTFLAIPDQGYLQLGDLEPAALVRLQASDLAAALDTLPAPSAAKPLQTVDLLPLEGAL